MGAKHNEVRGGRELVSVGGVSSWGFAPPSFMPPAPGILWSAVCWEMISNLIELLKVSVGFGKCNCN